MLTRQLIGTACGSLAREASYWYLTGEKEGGASRVEEWSGEGGSCAPEASRVFSVAASKASMNSARKQGSESTDLFVHAEQVVTLRTVEVLEHSVGQHEERCCGLVQRYFCGAQN